MIGHPEGPAYQVSKRRAYNVWIWSCSGILILGVGSTYENTCTLTRIDVEDPHITWWVEAMARHGGGGGPKVTYGPFLFHWLRGQLLMLEDYAYVGADFRDDPNLPLP